MKFNIRGNKLKVTPAIKSYIEEKIGKLDKYLENPEDVTATVVIRTRNKEQIVEVTMPIRKIILRGEVSHDDLYAAIDLVSEKIERQIRKNKTRMKRSVNRDILRDIKVNFTETKEEKEDSKNNKIVKRKEIEMKPMDEEEAILQMNLIGHDFFVYHDIKTNKVSVLYRRKDNDYGVIVTK